MWKSELTLTQIDKHSVDLEKLDVEGTWRSQNASCREPPPPSPQKRQIAARVTPVHAAARSLSICRSQENKWFQLAKMRLTISNWLIPKLRQLDPK